MSILDILYWLFGRKKAQKPAAMEARDVGESVEAERDIPKPPFANQDKAMPVKVIVVRQQSGFIDIRCPSCGSKCPSFLLADDPVLEDRTWRADCPSCGCAFNFKVKRESNEPSQSVSLGKSPGSVAYVLVTKQGSKPRDDCWYIEQVLKTLIPEALTIPDVKIKLLWETGVVDKYLAAFLVMKYFGTLDLEKYEIVLHHFSDADGDNGTLIVIYQKGEYKCSRCGSYFSTEQIQEHARYVGNICSAGLSQMVPGARSVAGTILVFDNGLAYCPKCIRSTEDISRYGRTVKKTL